MRIMICGRPGSGKTTFAFTLANLLCIPVHHLDRYFYISNWIERDYSEFIAIQKALVTQDKWIIDGNSKKSFNLRLARADVIVYFCYPRFTALWRIIKRRFFCTKNKAILDRAEGCNETIQWSLIKYMWTYEKNVGSTLRCLLKEYPKLKFFEIKADTDIPIVLKKLVALKSTAL